MKFCIFCGNAIYGIGVTKQDAFEDATPWVDFNLNGVMWEHIKDAPLSGFSVSYSVDKSDHNNYFYALVEDKLADFVIDNSGDLIWEAKVVNDKVCLFSDNPRLVEIPKDLNWNAPMRTH